MPDTMDELTIFSYRICEQNEALAEPLPDDGDFLYYWVATQLGTIDRWAERPVWPKGVRFVRPLPMVAHIGNKKDRVLWVS